MKKELGPKRSGKRPAAKKGKKARQTERPIDQSPVVEAADDGLRRKTRSASIIIRVMGFVIVSAVGMIILVLYGASPLLILEVFGLAAVLAISAVLLVAVLGRPLRREGKDRSR